VIVLLTWMSLLGLFLLVGGEIKAAIAHASPEGKAPGETTTTHGAPVLLNPTRRILARFQYFSHECDRRRAISAVPSLLCTQADGPMAVFFPRREKSKDEVSYARKIIGVI
jgi:hypothetical protein